ncbi:MAG: GGDEF domain-containing protein [Gallionella sp.]
MTPIELARQTLIQLSRSQSPPTPENFRRVYDEIAGIESVDQSNVLGNALEKLLIGMGKDQPKYAESATIISALIKKQDTVNLEGQLRKLLQMGSSDEDHVNWSLLLRYLLRQLDGNHRGLTLVRKKEELNQLLNNSRNSPGHLCAKIHALITSWGDEQPDLETGIGENRMSSERAASISTNPAIAAGTAEHGSARDADSQDSLSWRNMLIRTIELVVLPQFADNQGATHRIQSLLGQATSVRSPEQIRELEAALKATLLRTELQIDTQHRMQEGLVQMLRLLVASMGELTLEDKWLHGQIAIVQEIISKPLSLDSVYNAEGSLKELIYKQSALRPGFLEAKDTIKNMVSSFVDRLAAITESTGSYQAKIKVYQDQIKATEDVNQLNAILGSLVVDIATMNADAQQSHEAFRETQQKAKAAERQINELTTKLEYISEAAHQDFLTGALNRRGMDEAFDREFKRADRHNTPLSLAMLDIDHFKKINDTMGHSTGDMALAHLAKVVKSVLRSTDILARYGGEEFVILLPGTKQDDAVNVVAGVQRDLTKNFFLHNNERVLITFSAGVAERMTGENADEVLPRADAALYQAKHAGRNRVVGAELPLQPSGQ